MTRTINHLSPLMFATVANRAIELRADSYDIEEGHYDMGWHDAVDAALKEHNLLNDQPHISINPSAWHWPIYMFISDGYAETDMWINEQLKPNG